MSSVALSGNAGGTGVLTLAAPNTNTNRTLTLPDSDGTLLNTASSLAAASLTGDVAAARISTALNASGTAPVYACRAWVNFNGSGTVAIRSSGNVSSITDNGVGDYTVNFTTAMPDVNYAACITISGASATYNSPMILESIAPTTSSIRFINMYDADYAGFPAARDPAYCNVIINR